MPDIIIQLRQRIRSLFMRWQTARRKRKRMVFGFGEAKNVGVIFKVDSAAEQRTILNYVKSLQDLRLKVKCLGFFESKARPGFLNDHPDWTYCSRKGLSWNLGVKDQSVADFLNMELDVLIDLSPPGYFFTKYLSGMSLAHYKVGVFNDRLVDTYDLLMNVPATTSLKELMGHINHYLQIIKKPTQDA